MSSSSPTMTRMRGRRDSAAEVDGAKKALQTYWGSRGDEGSAEAAEACRKLSAAELRLVEAWIPTGNHGSSTAVKCERARQIVRGVLAEKV